MGSTKEQARCSRISLDYRTHLPQHSAASGTLSLQTALSQPYSYLFPLVYSPPEAFGGPTFPTFPSVIVCLLLWFLEGCSELFSAPQANHSQVFHPLLSVILRFLPPSLSYICPVIGCSAPCPSALCVLPYSS